MPMHNPPHPGAILREWLSGVPVTEAAGSLGTTRVALSRILNGRAGISAEMDVRLSRALGTTPGFWLGLNADHSLWKAQRCFKVKSIRAKTRLSQAQFARLLNVDVSTLRNWEQGRRKPQGPARALLKAVERDPKAVL